MRRKWGPALALSAALSALVFGLSFPVTGHAEPSTVAQREIGQLLDYIVESGCEFSRNGTWHPSGTAQAHLRGKYEYLARKNLINAAEDFISVAATRSSVTGHPYEVKCKNGALVASNRWLSEALAKFRVRP